MKYSVFNNVKSQNTRNCSVAELLELLGSDKLKSACEAIKAAMEGGDEKAANSMKSELPAIVLSERYKDGAPRKAGTGEPTGLFMIDYDYCKTEEELDKLQFAISRLAASHQILKDLIVAAHISPRRHGVHVWLRWIEGCKSIAECQAKFAEMAQLPDYDQSTKDSSRCSYLVHKSMFFVTNWGAMERNDGYAELQRKQSTPDLAFSRRHSAKATSPSERLRPTASELTHSSIPTAAQERKKDGKRIKSNDTGRGADATHVGSSGNADSGVNPDGQPEQQVGKNLNPQCSTVNGQCPIA